MYPPHGQEQPHGVEVVPVLLPEPAAELLPGPEVVEARVAGDRAGDLEARRTEQPDVGPDRRVGFVVLEPYDGKNIEDVLGANQLGEARSSVRR
ncbi:MAG: hypothetical protein ACLPKE_34995 [Streptosporangiaceae bacterium]